MTIDDVINRVKEIAEIAHDDETAHIREDSLWLDVLREIAAGSGIAQDLARVAIKTNEIDFFRWHA